MDREKLMSHTEFWEGIKKQDKWNANHPFIYRLKRIYWSIRTFIINLFSLIWIRHIKWFIQRGRRGYDDRYYWSVDSFLGPVILGVLKQFRDNDNHGYWAPIFKKKSEMKHENDFVDEKKSEKNEKRILKDMIEGFEFLTNHSDKLTEYYKKYPDKDAHDKFNRDCKKAQEKAKLFIDYFNNLWD